jgi:hypothetical protein
MGVTVDVHNKSKLGQALQQSEIFELSGVECPICETPTEMYQKIAGPESYNAFTNLSYVKVICPECECMADKAI